MPALNVPVVPGIATATEPMRALQAGIDAAGLAGYLVFSRHRRRRAGRGADPHCPLLPDLEGRRRVQRRPEPACCPAAVEALMAGVPAAVRR
jgi:hypothetical protein